MKKASKKRQPVTYPFGVGAVAVFVLLVGDSYQFEDSTGTGSDPDGTQFMVDTRSGISKTFAELTDADCAILAAEPNSPFSIRVVPSVVINSIEDNGNGTFSFNFTVINGTGTNSINFQYSSDGGTIWNSIATASNISDGVHSPSDIPNPVAGEVEIRIALTVGGPQYISNIESLTWSQIPITLGAATPDGSGGYNYPVTIEDGGESNLVTLSYSTDGGTTWHIFAGTTNMPDGINEFDHANPSGISGLTLVKATWTPAGGSPTDSNIIDVTF